MSDRHFSGDAERFASNIYATLKGQIRLAVLQADLQSLGHTLPPGHVLDAGAGLGHASELFVRAGHQVVHAEPASDMREAARARHQAAGLAHGYQYRDWTIQQLPEGQYPVVLCHAVLEWLADPAEALHRLVAQVAPGGWLSLMYYSRQAKVMANLVYGNFPYLERGLAAPKKVRFSPQQPLAPEQVNAWLAQEPLTLMVHSGVRCIHDFLRHPERVNAEELVRMELAYRRQEPYRQLGRYQHLLLRKEQV